MSTSVLITGGAGFIGANAVRRLLQEGWRCTVLDDLSTGEAANLDGVEVPIEVADVRDRDVVDRLVRDVDAVVHLAAISGVPPSMRDPVATADVNVVGTVAVLDAARRHGAQVILASSAAVYGPQPDVPTSEEHPTSPISPYAASKLAAEAYALAFMRSFGVRVLALRLFNVYGPLQRPGHAYAAVIPAFVTAALEGRPLVIHGDGEQSRDFVHVRVVTDVITRAIRSGTAHDQPVNVASGVSHTVNDVADALEAIIGHRLDRTFDGARQGDVVRSVADTSGLAELLGPLPAVELADGLTDLVLRGRTGQRAADPPG